jgi:septum formation protein
MTELILASGSAIRAELLRHAGVRFTVETAAVDEAEIKSSFHAAGRPAVDCAVVLAEAKAARVSRRHVGALVIGADQMLVCDGTWYDKPADRARARDQLLTLRGKRHELISAACVLRDGGRLWQIVERPALTMRHFSDHFLEEYLAASGDAALASVGAYQLEGRGVQLFERIEGDFFAILGLPLLPLLGFLRGHGMVRE